MRKKTYAMRYVAGQPVERIFQPAAMHYLKQQPASSGSLMPTEDRLRVMVWNIFKQQRTNWLSVLKGFGENTQLMLLQEAQSSPELIRFATTHYLSAEQVPAFVLPSHPSGVMTLSSAQPMYCFPLREREPLIRLAKSALITVYSLSDGRLLMVINIHAVNFSLGVEAYTKQLETIGEQLKRHNGPVVMAGDFNAWSQPRVSALYRFAHRMGLGEVVFSDDQRRRAFGRPLDFVFYRELGVANSSVLVTDASDHNPLLVEFDVS
ncbi:MULTISPECIES: endonuclease/exonuclease/phosphatase family protein [Dickeya]|uniref:endonuclease/exonuclease/phosphatase family protein n=1 Tax=Dickeya TaxID=204037 RepID=UPI0003A26DCC|nr:MULTISPECIES: endonuclease/exonuclease/phosphatase family protein [Dickeya]MBO8136113.1 endonuclease/exonuclease/phosphatase family protein [Dickeya fangzhongdai]UGA50076.1 endonuclease/exonuclease/phosphatase family protein [Dickeya fangzhongdai]ULR30142.1 endonuclease/exonuclease/phosphatase family protein [Dickeya fangzhongdai]UMB75795.1 endonuclease/exonuclease/phosphatase family protein [Dickeya fangzhongdai]UWH06431.1 endonuclease/exonuclease/phosphatase family protein [Dickeya fangzh